MKLLEIGSTLYNLLQWVVPSLLVIIAIMLTASVTKGYRGFLGGIQTILSSKYTLFLFAIIVIFFIYLWSELKLVIGW
jgi:hypothetical protein